MSTVKMATRWSSNDGRRGAGLAAGLALCAALIGCDDDGGGAEPDAHVWPGVDGGADGRVGDAADSDARVTDGAPGADARRLDARPTDAQPTDAQPTDAQPTDAQPTDAQPTDAQPTDGRPSDALTADAQRADAHPADARAPDAAPADARAPDAAPADARLPDALPPDATPGGEGPLAPRLPNRTCRLPDPAPLAGVRAVPAFPALRFDRPLDFRLAPGDPGTIYVAEQGGAIHAFDARPDVAESSVFLRVAVSRASNEEGLLGLAFHPNYADNGRLFVHASLPPEECPAPMTRCTAVVEYARHPDEPRRADPDSARPLLHIDQPFSNHNGGDVRFGPDGFLYIAVGDGGSGGDPRGHGQNPRTLLGAMLRIDVDAPVAPGDPAPRYGIPPGNPFADGRLGRPEIYAWGLRNPWRNAFDPVTGELWVADVGQDAWEEVNVITRPGNFGWATREGFACFRGGCRDDDGLMPPIHVYGRGDGRSITGGEVYRGAALPELWGAYLFSDFATGRLWALRRRVDAAPQVTLLAQGLGSVSSFGVDADGEVYLTTFRADRPVLKLERAAGGAGAPPPQWLSETGCFAEVAAHTWAEGVAPYRIRAPLWSDGTDKLRALALPPDGAATHRAEDSYATPTGTIALKTFSLTTADGGTRRVETRLMVHHGTGWRGYSYRWNDEQTDAMLINGPLNEVFDTPDGPLTWLYPSTAQCDQCHTAGAGFLLSFGARQLAGPPLADGRDEDQLAALIAAGYVRAPGVDPAAQPRHAALEDADATRESRARSYLEANCAMCHRPDGPGNAALDLRAATPLAQTGLCDAPTQGDRGLPDARILAPGEPDRSVLIERMAHRGPGQMPPLATTRPHPEALELLRAWITEDAPCR